MAPRSSGIDPAVLNGLSQQIRSSSARRVSSSSLPESVKLQALAAALAGTKFQQTGQGSDAVAIAQKRLKQSIDAITSSDAPNSAKNSAKGQGDTKSSNESALTKILNVLGKPKTAVVAGIAHVLDPNRNFMKDLQHNVGTSDVLAKADWFKNLPTAAKVAVGITGDIAADPLTYLTGSGVIEAAGGATGVAEKLANVAADSQNLASRFAKVGMAEQAANAAAKADKAVEIGGNLLRKGTGGIGGLSNAELNWVGKVTGLGEDLKGGLYFQTPLTGRFGNYAAKKLTGSGIDAAKYQIYLGRGPFVQAVSSGAYNALGGLKTSKLMSEIGDKWKGSTGEIKRAILNASTPEEALRIRTAFSGARMGEGAGLAVATGLEKEMADLYKTAANNGVSAETIGHALDGNHDAVAAVDKAVGHVLSRETGQMVPFSQRLREFNTSIVETANSQIQRVAQHIGVDPATVDSLVRLQEGHVHGLLTDQARQMLTDLGDLNKSNTGTKGIQGFQNRATYGAGQEFLGTPIGSPNRDLTHATVEIGGNKYVVQPKDGKFTKGLGPQADAAAKSNVDGTVIQNNDKAAQEYLNSQPVKDEVAAAKKAITAAKTPEEKAAAQQFLTELQLKHQQESQSLLHVRVQRNGEQQFMIVPTDRLQTRGIPQTTIGPKSQVNAISQEVNGFPMFNMDWGAIGNEQIRQITNAVKDEVAALNLKRYGTLGGLPYAADLSVPDSALRAQQDIQAARAEANAAKSIVDSSQSATLARQHEAYQFAIDNADQIRTARDRLLNVIQREGKLSATPKRKQLAVLEHDLEIAMRKLDTERAAFQKASENLNMLNSQLFGARMRYATAADAASRSAAEGEIAAIERQIGNGVDHITAPEKMAETVPMQVPAPPPLMPEDTLAKAQADFHLQAQQSQDALASTPDAGLDTQKLIDAKQSELTDLRRMKPSLRTDIDAQRMKDLTQELRDLRDGTSAGSGMASHRRMVEAQQLVNSEPDVMQSAADYQRLITEANTPNGNVSKVFGDIKTENARGFTPEMKDAVASVSPAVAGDAEAQTALLNPEVASSQDAVDAVAASSKAKADLSTELPITHAAGQDILAKTDQQFASEAQQVVSDIQSEIARQTQYGVKNRAGRVANLEQQVAQIEQDWIALDEKIRKLDDMFAAETARRAADAREQFTPLMEQIISIKEAVRVAKQAEMDALKMYNSRLSTSEFISWLKTPAAQQQVETTLASGWTRLGKTTKIPNEVSDMLQMMAKTSRPEDLGAFFGMFDKLTSLFKKWAIASPGFITRNGFGGMFNNWLGGVDAGRYTEFLRADHAFYKARHAGDSIEKAFEAIKNPEIRDAYKLLHASGVLAETDQAMDAAYGLNRAIATKVGHSQKDVGFLSDNAITRSVYKGNHRMERVLRGAAGMDAASKTKSIDQVYETVFKLHFNYSDLNNFEVNVMKRVSPFYAWSRFNLPLQLEMLVRNPKVYNHYNIVARNINSLSSPEDIVPSWMKDRMAISLPWDTSGGRMYAIPDLPLNSLNLVTNLDEMGGQINPVIKTPFEMALNRKLYFGKSAPFREGMVLVPKTFLPFAPALQALGMAQKDKSGAYVTRDKYLYALEQFMPFMGRARRLAPDEQKYQDRLPTTVVNFLFGAGLRTNTESDKLGELSSRQQTVDQIAKDLNTMGYGGYVTWTKQVSVSRKPVKGQDKNPYLTLISPKGGLGANSPYTNVPTKLSTGQMLAALKARQG